MLKILLTGINRLSELELKTILFIKHLYSLKALDGFDLYFNQRKNYIEHGMFNNNLIGINGPSKKEEIELFTNNKPNETNSKNVNSVNSNVLLI